MSATSKSPFLSLWALDGRSLALFRITLGLVACWKALSTLPEVAVFFSDSGALPRHLLLENSDPWRWSLHHLLGHPAWPALLLVLQALAALAFAIGWRTRQANLLLWLLLASLQVRNPEVLHSGDTVLRVILFWCLFCPLGRHASLDAWQARELQSCPPPDKQVLEAGVLALQAQVVMIYLFSALHKTHPEWTVDGTAVYYALKGDLYALPAGKWLLHYEALCRWVTFSVRWLEMLGPLLLFLPVARATCRMLTVLLFLGLHAGFALCLDLAAFSFTMMALWMMFLPPEFWNWLERHGRLLHLLQREAARAVLESYSVLLSWLQRHASLPAKPLGKWSSCLVLLLIVYVGLWNWRSLNPKTNARYFPPSINLPGRILRLEQGWDMYAPRPFHKDGWFILQARLADGSEVDLLRGGRPVSFAKPEHITATFPSYHWRKFLLNLREKANRKYRYPLGSYLARKWNESHPPGLRVQNWTLLFMSEQSKPPGQPEPVKEDLLWKWTGKK